MFKFKSQEIEKALRVSTCNKSIKVYQVQRLDYHDLTKALENHPGQPTEEVGNDVLDTYCDPENESYVCETSIGLIVIGVEGNEIDMICDFDGTYENLVTNLISEVA